MSEPEALTIDPGKIQFYHHFLPLLGDGKYEIQVDQKLTLVDGTKKEFSQKRTFHVQPRRFGLGPRDVQAVYPPANSEGTYDQTLPHIVLRKRALPWERGTGTEAGRPLPWMALLHLHGDEIRPVETVPVTDIIPQGANPKDGVLRPAIPATAVGEEEPGGRALTIDIGASTFLAIAPTLADFALI